MTSVYIVKCQFAACEFETLSRENALSDQSYRAFGYFSALHVIRNHRCR